MTGIWHADVAVIGGGLGGIAASIALAERQHTVLLICATDWLGGQMTDQAVPPDEHVWIERFGCNPGYRSMRNSIRDYYRRNYPLRPEIMSEKTLNPGGGWVSRICHEPRIGAAVLEAMLAPLVSSSHVRILRQSRVAQTELLGDRILGVQVTPTGALGHAGWVSADYFLDASEKGELYPLAGAEYRLGAESSRDTGEPHGIDTADPLDQQAMTFPFAVELADGDWRIDKPSDYAYWRDVSPEGWGGPLLGWVSPDPRTLEPVLRDFLPNQETCETSDETDHSRNTDLWSYRRILARRNFDPQRFKSDISVVNWPQNDYFITPAVSDQLEDEHRSTLRARSLSLSLLFWLQNEAPRPDGGTGFPGLRLVPDVMGTTDGFSREPYIREGRRLVAETTIYEQDLSLDVRREHGSVKYRDSVGIGMYRIDLHPTTGGRAYVDIATCPFQIPLGALIPVRVKNLLGAGRGIGTTQITNGCYRLHPTEWAIGEAAGVAAAQAIARRLPAQGLRRARGVLDDIQAQLQRGGVELSWPDGLRGY